MSDYRQLLQTIRAKISEIEPSQAAELIAAKAATLLDVRDLDEVAQGSVEQAINLPRSNLESQVEQLLPDKDHPVVVMCAGGSRSVFVTATMEELGYRQVSSMAGGFNQWKEDALPWSVPKVLNEAQRSRYGRHLSLPEVGPAGQQKLLDSKVLVVGAGGLGSPVALYLAAAGVGTLGIIDMDMVDASNLQRQVIHRNDRVGQPKVASAKRTVEALNPDVKVETYQSPLSAANAVEIVQNYDVIVDGADNFPTRYLLNDVTVKLGIPLVYGSIFRFEGQVSVFDPRNGPSYRDLVPTAPSDGVAPSCAEAGVLGVLPGVIGTIQALETLKLLLGIGQSLAGRLIVFDALEMRFHEYQLKPNPDNSVTYKNRAQIKI